MSLLLLLIASGLRTDKTMSTKSKKCTEHKGRSLQSESEITRLRNEDLPQFSREAKVVSRKLVAKIRRSLEGRRHSDSVKLIREDRQR